MLSWFLLLQYIVYLSPEIGLIPRFTTEHCIVFDSDSRLFNRIVNDGVPSSSELSQIKSYFNDNRFAWFVNTADVETQKIVEKNGLKSEFTGPAMRAELGTVKLEYSDDIAIEIIKVESNALAKLVDIVGHAFKLDTKELLKGMRLFDEKMQQGTLKLYLGFYKGEAVSAGMGVIHSTNVVSVHCIGTYSEFRKKGLAHAITQKIMFDAQNMGCTLAVLLCSFSLEPFYQKLGFKTYTTYAVYTP